MFLESYLKYLNQDMAYIDSINDLKEFYSGYGSSVETLNYLIVAY